MSAYEIPLSPSAQSFSVPLAGTTYKITCRWNTPMQAWVLDFADQNAVPILSGVPIVTGTDLLIQYQYLGFGGGLVALTDGNADAVPTFANLGLDGNLYFLPDDA